MSVSFFRIKDSYIIKSDIPSWTKGSSGFTAPNLSTPIVARVSEMPARYEVEEHQHPWGQLAYASHGIMKVKIPNASFIIPPERALWIPQHTPHIISTRFGLSFRSLYIDDHWSVQLPSTSVSIEVNPLLRELILSVTSWPEDFPQTQSTTNLMKVLIDQIATSSRAPLFLNMPIDRRLIKICDHLKNEPACNKTLQQWSETTGATSRTLNRLFLKETQMGFVEWRQRLRILFSLERLEKGDNIDSIALDLGYESGSAFITMFKKHLGAPPKKYFKQNLALTFKKAICSIESAS